MRPYQKKSTCQKSFLNIDDTTSTYSQVPERLQISVYNKKILFLIVKHFKVLKWLPIRKMSISFSHFLPLSKKKTSDQKLLFLWRNIRTRTLPISSILVINSWCSCLAKNGLFKQTKNLSCVFIPPNSFNKKKYMSRHTHLLTTYI